MSTSENNPSGLVPHKDHHAVRDSSEQDMIPVDNLIDLERARIDNLNRQVEVAKESIAASERNDKRLFDFSMQRLQYKMDAFRARQKTSKTLLYAGGLVFVLALGFLLFHAFYGNEKQNEYAVAIIKNLAIFFAGYGFISGIAALVKRFFKQGNEE